MSAPFTFNLVDEPWLPCVERSDRGPVALGLREALVRAHDLRELVDVSPLVTAALHRLLLALIHRIFGPPSIDAWLDLWRAGSWDAGRIDAYLAQWRLRLDLFHPEHPFYQTRQLRTASPGAATALVLELASGNNATLFDHTLDAHYLPLSSALAARTVVTFQAFAPGGLVSFEKGQTQHRSANAAPLTKGAMALIRGDSLFETPQLKLMRYAPKQSSHQAPRPMTDRPGRAEQT
jgi:CRISPR system Cascade subunit CasA